VDPTIEITPEGVQRLLGIDIPAEKIADILRSLAFEVQIEGQVVRATTPDHRLDIGEGAVGVADLVEEIARIYGYDRIPETQISDTIPPQYGNPSLEREERVRDLLVGLGLQEVVSYRMTSPEREARHLPPETPPDDKPYFRLANPIASDRVVMRHSLLASILEIVERNARVRERISLFEIGPVYLVSEEGALPEEQLRLAIALTGPRDLLTWHGGNVEQMDFYDLKGIIDALLGGLGLDKARYETAEHPSFHPGKSARVLLGETQVGLLGELHPKVHERYDLPETPLVAAILDIEIVLAAVKDMRSVQPVPIFPPVLEDLAVVVDENVPAELVEEVIRKAGGHLLVGVTLFDLYRGEQVDKGKKSLAYSLVYQAPERTLTDEEIANIRAKVIKKLGSELKAKLRE
jgi:phenylalanyl-tRNA synthetase beta chain